MKTRILAVVALLFVTLVSPARAAVHSTATPNVEKRTPPAQSLIAPARPSYGSRADEKRYAAREAASKNAKKYRAGEAVVVITATAAIIILLGIIIILLVT
jgi:hypothetical protein